MTIDSCKIQAQEFERGSNNAPVLPPRPPIEYECCKTFPQPETQTVHAVEEPKMKQKQRRCRNKAFVVLGAFVALAFLLSVASVLFTVFTGNNGTVIKSPQQSMQNSNMAFTDLIERVKILESIQQPTDNVSLLLPRISELERIINDFNTRQSLFMHTVNSVQSSLVDTNTRLIAIETQLNSTSSALHATDNRLSATSSDLSNMRTSLRSVNLFRCFREEATCTVLQHTSNGRWFLCTTASKRITRLVSLVYCFANFFVH